MQERAAFRINGFSALLLALALLGLGIGAVAAGAPVAGSGAPPSPAFWLGLACVVAFGLMLPGFYTVQPNEARALTFFGRYAGSVRQDGFHWSNPLAARKTLSLRVRNFNSERLKVNDAHGNPIEIAAVIVWKVVDSARALFEVEAYESFVAIQAETSIRTLASHFPYDAHDTDQPSLRGSPEEVAAALVRGLGQKLEQAGVAILDARISHLAYAQEIAQAMLRRQQASAIIAARTQIVEGAVGMVELALRRLSEKGVVELDEERKAAMVSNLLVVLVSESQTQPIVNAGTLY